MYIVLGRPECPFCDKAKELLEAKNLPFVYVDVLDPSQSSWVKWLKANDIKTVPQVFKLMPGGYENLKADIFYDGVMDD